MNIEKTNKSNPKVPEEKSASKWNALKHGLLSKEVLMDDEDPKALEDLGIDIRDQLNPVGSLEVMLVDRIISSFWRLRRALAVERNTMEWNRDYVELDFSLGLPQSDEQDKRKSMRDMLHNDTIEKIVRYETTTERAIFRALHELERLQERRNGKRVPLPIPLDVTVQGIGEMGSFGRNHNE